MKLIIQEQGDRIRISNTNYEVDCPFDESADQDVREYFRDNILICFGEYSESSLIAYYSDEPGYWGE